MIVKIITDNTDIKNIFKELEKSNLLGIDRVYSRKNILSDIKFNSIGCK